MVFEKKNFARADGQVKETQEHAHDIDKCAFEVMVQLMKLVERSTSVTIKRDEVSDGHVIGVTCTNPWAYAQRNSILEALKDCNTSLDGRVVGKL